MGDRIVDKQVGKKNLEGQPEPDAKTLQKRRQSDRLDQLNEHKIHAARNVLLKFLEDYEYHCKAKVAGIDHSKDWILEYPARFVREIEYAQKIYELKEAMR